MLISKPAQARWATVGDSPILVKDSSWHYKVEANGTYSMTSDVWSEVRNDAGRDLGTNTFTYNPQSEQFTVLEAETVNHGERIPVPDEMIEDRPVAATAEGFDTLNQVKVVFPRVEVGSRLHLSYRVDVKVVPIPGIFSIERIFGSPYWESGTRITIESKIPLNIKAQGPEGKIKVKTSIKDGLQLSEITLQDPVLSEVIDEPQPYWSGVLRTMVEISSETNYDRIGAGLARGFEREISASLPTLYEKIYQEARLLVGLTTRMNFITSTLADNLRYTQDWRTINGGIIPRKMSAVAESGFGDCKDFTVAVVAIARKLGYSSFPAIIQRSDDPFLLPAIPAMFGNHAVAVMVENGRETWIDSTNTSSFAQGTYFDISGRPALVLDPKSPQIHYTPKILVTEGRRHKIETIHFRAGLQADLEISVDLKGAAALDLTGLEKTNSKESIRAEIVKTLGEGHVVRSSKIADFDLNSRIVNDRRFTAQLSLDSYSVRSSSGKTMIMESSLGFLRTLRVEDRVTGVFLGRPGVDQKTKIFREVSLAGGVAIDCNINSPWLTLSRKVTNGDREVRIEDTYLPRVDAISAADLHSETFRRLQRELNLCFDAVVLTFQKLKSDRPEKENISDALVH
jgi:hypothetical protein